jgi:hypothetical protein
MLCLKQTDSRQLTDMGIVAKTIEAVYYQRVATAYNA